MSEQGRAQRQLKAFRAAQLIRQLMGYSDPKIGTDVHRIEEIRIAALSAIAESRAVMHALVTAGVIPEADVDRHLDWGYDNLLAQIEQGLTQRIMEAGHG